MDALTDDAIRRVEAHAPADWWETAYERLREFLPLATELNGGIFTAPDFIRNSGVSKPPEPRALGALMQRAQRAGLIERTHDWCPSPDPLQHRRPVRVWRVR